MDMMRPWLNDELRLGVAAVIDDVVVGLEYPVFELVVAKELPQVPDQVEFG